jgi:hypothetical protein
MRPIRKPPRKESVDERETSAEWRRLYGPTAELKIMQCNHDGWPDRWYRCPIIGPFWCEWKAEGKEPEQHQLLRHRELEAQGEIVIVAHSREEFWRQVREMRKNNGL